MIRFYCDSNIFGVTKDKHPYYNKPLHDLIESLKDKVLFTFSDAHLDDLKDSLKEYRDVDLHFMGNYVKDNYFHRDPIKKVTECLLASPFDAFYSHDYDAAEKLLSNPFDFNSLFEGLGDSPEIKILTDKLKSFLDMPISAFGEIPDTSNLDEKNKQLLYKFIPGYNSNLSLGDLMKACMPYGVKLLQDKKEVNELRKSISSYMDRDSYSFDKWGMDFNEKFKETSIGKSFFDYIDSSLLENQKNDFYIRFSYAYKMLEMYNITQERSGGKLKKFDYESLNNDSNHAYFASYSDYLITDDKGLQVKANILYQIFKIPTKVLSIKDFLNLKTLVLDREETIENFSKTLIYDYEKALQLGKKYSIENDSVTETYKNHHVYFNYFNRFQKIQNDSLNYFVLYCDRRSHANFIMYRELELIISKLLDLFGMDDEGKGIYMLEEKEGNAHKVIWQSPACYII